MTINIGVFMSNATDLRRWVAARRVRQQPACRWSASAAAAGSAV
jgi:hypothetical protein